ncbi:MAG: DUF177 domain-containing protein [Peptococcaceae bacterium]|nr:DUF177 domain-containing protein [Peptococcaceae bacterium]
MLPIDVSLFNRGQIDSKKYSLSAEMPTLDMSGESISFIDPVRADLSLTLTGPEPTIVVEGTFSGQLGLQCVRCLELYQYGFIMVFREVYTRRATDETDEEISFIGDTIDLEPEVLKNVILALPMKAICREECRGLCPHCGCNLNTGECGCAGEDIDPRFSVLSELLKK